MIPRPAFTSIESWAAFLNLARDLGIYFPSEAADQMRLFNAFQAGQLFELQQQINAIKQPVALASSSDPATTRE